MDLNHSTLSESVQEGDALLIVPPFAPLDWPALGVHILQACAREAGFRVSILYANFLLAVAIGVENYVAFNNNAGQRVSRLIGECLFAHSAYGLPLLDNWVRKSDLAMLLEGAPAEQIDALDDLLAAFPLTPAHLRGIEETASLWLGELAEAVVGLGFPIVGATTSFEQTNAAIALLKRIKQRNTKVITLIGGANCAGEMAEGIASLDPDVQCIDYVFSAESETTFLDFLRGFVADKFPSARVIHGEPCQDLNALPTPDFREYVEQLDRFIPGAQDILGGAFLCYENSRGCWWGEKHQCKFCGGIGESIVYRPKAAERVLEDLDLFAEIYPIRRIVFVDRVMPRAFFQTLLPELETRSCDLEFTGLLRANLSLDNVLALKRAGFSSFGAGIESLSSGLLALANKGLEARQAIALLRYTRSADVYLRWNFLWGFPGDTLEMYEGMLALLPLIRHLQPPDEVVHLVIVRFSPYFTTPEAYGLRNVHPLASYAAPFPPYADMDKLAMNFAADYESAAHRNLGLMADLIGELAAWQRYWREEITTPIIALQVVEFAGRYILMDTRGLPDTQNVTLLTPAQAAAALVSQPYVDTAEIAWALEHKVGVVRDGWYIPLATATPELLQAFESGAAPVASSTVAVEPALASR